MAYIGKQPVVGNFVKLDAIVTSATATYNLLNSGVAYFPQTANNCIVSLNGVIQSPTSAYTISGSTIVFDSALTALDTIDFILVLGDVLSIGTPSDGTVTSAKLASGTVGLISWQSVQTTGFTASAGRGYPLNTTSAAFTVTLPATPSVGDTIILLDYAGTFATNAITIARNGSPIEGGTDNKRLTTNREAVTITYVDATQGWVSTSASNYGTQSLDLTTYTGEYLIISGGGGGGQSGGGGGGGGVVSSPSSFTFGTSYTVTIGAGGAACPGPAPATNTQGTASSIPAISTTSVGGGFGGERGTRAGGSGGSGGGGGADPGPTSAGGAGTSGQGFAGGTGTGNPSGTPIAPGGGGGAGAVGTNFSGPQSGPGGAGTNVYSTWASATTTGVSGFYAGGGGGGGNQLAGTGGSGGGGRGGQGSPALSVQNGTANTGGGGGGINGPVSGSGGSGIIIIRYQSATQLGTGGTVTSSGGYYYHTFTSSGTYTG